MKQKALAPQEQNYSTNAPAKPFSSYYTLNIKKAILSIAILQINMLLCVFVSLGQELILTGQVINPNQEPLSKVRVSLQSKPEIYCYSDQFGNFSLSEIQTGINDQEAIDRSIQFHKNGKLIIDAQNEPLQISIIDIMGRNMGMIVYEKNLNGINEIYPSAYIQDLPKGIYIAMVSLGSYQKGFRLNNFTRVSAPKGLQYFGSSSESSDETISLTLKSNTNSADTIIFEHDFYKIKHVFAPDLNADIGVVELENFGDYSIPTDMEPVKTDLYSRNGAVINLLGKDSSEFIIYFNPYSTFDEKLSIKAIPIDELPGLASDIELISAVHLEPGGVHFNVLADVIVDLHDIPISDSLVVFLYDNITNKTYYIPYHDQSSYDNNLIVFSISHFSDYGIGYQPEFPEDSGEPLTSDDFITEINYHLFHNEEIPDDLFTVWFEQIVLQTIDAVTNIESLQIAMSEISLLSKYINYIGKDISEFSFFDELTSSMATKLNFIFKIINDECESNSDPCTKKDLAIIANTMVQFTQKFPGVAPLNISDICNGEIQEIIFDFMLVETMVNLDVSDEIQITHTLYDVRNEEIDSEIDPDFEWISEDPNIASVNQDGIITGIKKGKVKVFAKFCDIERYVNVYVNEDLNYCSSDTNIYSGTLHYYSYKAFHNGGSSTYNGIVKITANLKEGTWVGYASVAIKSILYKRVGTRYVYDRTTYTFSSGPLHPSHRLGDLTCMKDRQYHILDVRAMGDIRLYPQTGIFTGDMNEYHATGFLIRH